jgi:hypothetical protein
MPSNEVTMRLPISSWSLFIIMTLGLIVLLVGQRPELQGTEGQGGPGKVVRIVGHSITWGAAAALTVRMIRSSRGASSPAAGQLDPPKRAPNEPVEPLS